MDPDDLVRRALEEDGYSRDLTSLATVPETAAARGVLLAKEDLVVAGLDVVRRVFELGDPRSTMQSMVGEGERVGAGTVIAEVAGTARGLLATERVALNFLQRLSGVATLTRRYVDAVAGTKAHVRDTRKTTPLLRELQKHAVVAGGGHAHRAGLDAGILIKDNHVRLAGSVEDAVRRARAAFPDVPVEAEVERLDQIEPAIAAGAHMLLLDNFPPERVREAIEQVGGRVPVEVSGGVTLQTVRAYAEAGADYIAVGALTHSAPGVDISLEVEPA